MRSDRFSNSPMTFDGNEGNLFIIFLFYFLLLLFFFWARLLRVPLFLPCAPILSVTRPTATGFENRLQSDCSAPIRPILLSTLTDKQRQESRDSLHKRRKWKTIDVDSNNTTGPPKTITHWRRCNMWRPSWNTQTGERGGKKKGLFFLSFLKWLAPRKLFQHVSV